MMAKKRSSTRAKGKDDVEFDFESSLGEVEQIVAKLESGELSLTESLEQYESGIRHLKRCQSLLDAAEQRVSLLSGFDAAGNPVTTSIDEIDSTGGRSIGARKAQASPTSLAPEGADDALDRRGGDSVDDSPGLF